MPGWRYEVRGSDHHDGSSDREEGLDPGAADGRRRLRARGSCGLRLLTELTRQSIGAFLTGIASADPAPGAGSAAGVALALGLACARKAIVLTLKHQADEPALRALEKHLAGLAEQAIAGGEADISCFTAYIDAMRRPKDDVGRARAEQDALADLVAVGENLIAVGDEARRKLLEVKTEIYPSMINDVAAALALIAAARAIHTACVAESARALAG